MEKYIITCTGKKLIAENVYELNFKKPKDFLFQAGQFALWDVPLLDNPEDIQTRAYSIASAPFEEEFVFVIKLVPAGRASTWVEKVLDEGMKMSIQGPFGNFVLKDRPRKDYLLISTGSGNAPYRSQLLTLADQSFEGNIDVLMGFRYEEDVYWQTLFEELSDINPNIKVNVTLTKPSDNWTGLKGRVNTVVPELYPDLLNKYIYACGNPAMTMQIKKLCLEEWGIGKEDVHIEGYI